MASDRTTILFPSRPVHPLRSLLRRIGIAAVAVVFIALVTYIGRDGYRDADGNRLTMLDAFYYATVTLTTTGYGDITPVAPSARAITAFLVTPVRVLFLIVLIGTTLELLTERFREARAETRWRKRVNDHTIVVGHGTKGRGAIDSLKACGTAIVDIVVIDSSRSAVEEARSAGLTAVHGDATRSPVLAEAEVERARAVVVTSRGDDTATLVTLTVRELNLTATIVAAVRESENAHLLLQSGADTVITSSEAAGRLLGLATVQSDAVAVLEDVIEAGEGLQLGQRPAAPTEMGGPPQPGPAELPIAVVRDGVRLSFADPAFRSLKAGDVVVVLQAN
ncbi:MAG: potassium channel family protein [Acidimicrobiales bacterium]